MSEQCGTQSSRGFFITGTDTGVGKTVFTAALAARLREAGRDVVALKPVASGATLIDGRRTSADALFLEWAARSGEPLDALNPVLLDAPLAPAVAARIEGRSVDVEALARHCLAVCARHHVALVEGVGGLMVPLAGDRLVADLALLIGLPLIIVARPALGTINHTLLTIAFARSLGLRVAGVVIGDFPDQPGLAEQTSPAEIERLGGVPILATLPHADGLDVDCVKMRSQRAGGLPRTRRPTETSVGTAPNGVKISRKRAGNSLVDSLDLPLQRLRRLIFTPLGTAPTTAQTSHLHAIEAPSPGCWQRLPAAIDLRRFEAFLA